MTKVNSKMMTLEDKALPKIGSKAALVDVDVLQGDFKIAKKRTVLIDQGTITGILESDQPGVDLRDHCLIQGSGHLVIPGFINAHTHAPMGFFRGFGHGQSNMIENFLFPSEKALTPELTEPLSYSYLWGALTSGCTHMVDHYYFSEGVGRAMEKLGMRATLGECVADLGGAFPGRETWTRARKMIENWPFSSLIQPCVAPHAADTVSMELLTEMSQFAARHALPLHMHLSQTQGEWERVHRRSSCTPVGYAARAGALSERTLAVHLVSASAADIDILVSHGVTAVICPQSEVIYERLPPLQVMIEKGLPMALATDCAASNDSADMFAEVKFMSMILAIHGMQIDARKLLEMGFFAARQPLGLKNPSGIAVGATADLVLIQQSVDILPLDMVADNLVYSISPRHVRHVMIDGKWVVWQRDPVNMSQQDMKEAYQEAVSRLPGFVV